MTIIIPMAGLSSRFSKEGFTLPKYMLYIKNKSLFYLSMEGFQSFFDEFEFVFITRKIFDSKLFIEKECDLLGISKYKIIELEHTTSGQAETVYIGLKAIKSYPETNILIHNIDTFKKSYIIPERIIEWDGYLEVFLGDGENWSYALTEHDSSTKVIKTAEKKQISQYCSTGLYYFESRDLFVKTYEEFYLNNLKSTEQYIAPMYNLLIDKGLSIHIDLIDKRDIVFCGIPDEYYDYVKIISSRI